MTFVTAGYPTPADTVPILLGMQAGGADIIELGVPFSDPIADGPAIQETNTVCVLLVSNRTPCIDLFKIALKNDVDYATVLRILTQARQQGLTAPVILMGKSLRRCIISFSSGPLTGYYNPLLAYGEDKAILDAREAGANGFIMVDLPPEEAITFREKCTKAKRVSSTSAVGRDPHQVTAYPMFP